ncbi:MAG: nickel pincer cofactor biosynthesis protein LarC [Oscillospiraceae bacterium]|nr:nickel pincer cofactor biosynthesis protein LarC [Oscillospiraceae bacterium]
MKTLYLECSMGAAGDMLTAALLELLPDPEPFLTQMNHLGLADVTVRAERTAVQGICGTKMHVLVHGAEESDEVHSHHHGGEHHHHAHHHASMDEITSLISSLQVSERVRRDALSVYQLIAEAESQAHGCPVAEIHFHEVGTKDAIADVVGVCLLMEMLAPEKILASPVHTGSGHVHCAHGILPVPAPATAWLLRGIPMYSGEIEGELCTPTGAALLRYFADSFGAMPPMKTEKTGYGFGHKVFPRLNCVRAFLGETAEQPEEILELICNLDDMTGEALGFAQEELLAAGAADVYTVPIMMKKGRPAFQMVCLCRPMQRDTMLKLIFRHTTTLGVREHRCPRYVMQRESESLETKLGTVRVKHAEGFGVQRSKAEYADLAAIARSNDLTLREAEMLI